MWSTFEWDNINNRKQSNKQTMRFKGGTAINGLKKKMACVDRSKKGR